VNVTVYFVLCPAHLFSNLDIFEKEYLPSNCRGDNARLRSILQTATDELYNGWELEQLHPAISRSISVEQDLADWQPLLAWLQAKEGAWRPSEGINPLPVTA